MLKQSFLLEIGVEEIPAGYIHQAISSLKNKFESTLKEEKLEYGKIKLFSTPRRFAIKIDSLQSKQLDETIEKIGPPKKISYDGDGSLTKAGSGFLKGANATEEDVFFKKTAKGEKLAIKKEVKGKETTEIIKNITKSFINELSFPKSMKWGKSKLQFARPIRWILALFGDELINLNIDGVKLQRITYGNRFQSLNNSLEIAKIEEYEDKLKKGFVIVDREERKQLIKKQLQELFKNTNRSVMQNNRLLETVVDLVEYPTAGVASFDEKYIKLPRLVVTSTLSEHQKYFSVIKENGDLSNEFVFISNGNPDYSDLIKVGNEKVIKARLDDAEFFYLEDTGAPLENFVPKLKDVTFQEDLGSIYEKTERIIKLVDFICNILNIDISDKTNAIRAAKLCKADLVTLMLGEKEFTKLQGYIGRYYALKSGEKSDVAQAIEEHYSNGNKNISTIGAIVAIADKVDTICGIIGVGLKPTGSKDPFALRRAANAIIKIIANQKFELDIHELIKYAFSILDDKLKKAELSFVNDYFKKRIEWFLQQSEIDYDVIDSVMHIDFSNIPDLLRRAVALQSVKAQSDFIKLVLGFKRVSNIIADYDKLDEVDVSLLKNETEILFYKEYKKLKTKIIKLLKINDYEEILEILIGFGEKIDNFFDDVLVNVDDKALQQNRLNLLKLIRDLFIKVADISKIVVEN